MHFPFYYFQNDDYRFCYDLCGRLSNVQQLRSPINLVVIQCIGVTHPSEIERFMPGEKICFKICHIFGGGPMEKGVKNEVIPLGHFTKHKTLIFRSTIGNVVEVQSSIFLRFLKKAKLIRMWQVFATFGYSIIMFGRFIL